MPRTKHNPNLLADTVKAARVVIKREGLRGLDVRKIANEIGCSIGTFYNLFKSLDDLVVHFNSVTLDLLEDALTVGITNKDSDKTVLKKICCNYLQFSRENTSEWLLLFEYQIERPTPIKYQQKIDRLFTKIQKLIHPIFGGSPDKMDDVVKVLWSSLHGICSLILRDKLKGDPLELCLNLVNHYSVGYRVSLL
jgi:AcrR family transcriptional regulator